METTNYKLEAVKLLRKAGWNGENTPTSAQVKAAYAATNSYDIGKELRSCLEVRGMAVPALAVARESGDCKGGRLTAWTSSGRELEWEGTLPLPDSSWYFPGWESQDKWEMPGNWQEFHNLACELPASPCVLKHAADSEAFASGVFHEGSEERKMAGWLKDIASLTRSIDRVRRSYRGTRLYAALRKAGVDLNRAKALHLI